MNERDDKNQDQLQDQDQHQHHEGKRITKELGGILIFIVGAAIALAVLFYFLKM